MNEIKVDKDEIRALIKKHKGEFHGPRVEHLSIPESNFWEFIAEYSDFLVNRALWD